MDWLLAPIDATRPHGVEPALSWHGRLMVLAWGVGAPLAVLIARFFKILPGQDWPRDLDRKVWWHCHWMGHSAVVALTLVGLLLAFVAQGPGAGLHRVFGLAVVVFALVQLGLGLGRGTKGGPTAPAPDGSPRGDHYDMTPRRQRFEAVHKGVGYLTLALGAVAVIQGLWLANGPRWMWLAGGLWWLALLGGAVVLQRRGWAVDTYQAIWGPGLEHPGNRRQAPGWGMHRPAEPPQGPGHRQEGER